MSETTEASAFPNAPFGGSDDHILSVCHACHAPLEISRVDPNEETLCPRCGNVIRLSACRTQDTSGAATRVHKLQPNPAEAAPQAGDKLIDGRYELHEKLGEGGMAIVYRALDLQNGSHVALKMMKSALGETGLKRFQREFGAIAAVRHPNCIQVLDSGAAPVGPYFTMELFSGAPITALRGLPQSLVLQALHQAACAIDHVHAQGIIHRDVKPSNLLVRVEDAEADRPAALVKLSDFGLARFAESGSGLTQTGAFVGTALYCAPEQIENEMLDERVDL